MAISVGTFAEEFAEGCREAGWVRPDGEINKVAAAYHLGLDDTRTVSNWLNPEYPYGPRSRQLGLMRRHFSRARIERILSALEVKGMGRSLNYPFLNRLLPWLTPSAPQAA